MITYVDTSSLLKLLVEEEGSATAEVIWETADALASVHLIIVEARAALAAAFRDGRLSESQHRTAKSDLLALIGDLHLVDVTEEIIMDAAELAEAEALRGYDAVHLAGALRVHASVLASADSHLCDAASRNDLHVANPLWPNPPPSPRI